MATKSTHAPLNVYVVAPAGTSQATATVIKDALVPGLLLVAGDATTGVKLPAASKGKLLYLKNTGVNGLAILNVYPFLGDGINVLAANAPLVMQPQTSCVLIADRAHVWHTIPVKPS